MNAILPLLFTVFLAIPALADGPGGIDLEKIPSKRMGATATETTATPLTLYQNTIEIITLNEDAGSIILSNPAPVEMMVENSRRLILRPMAQGVTALTIINPAGQIIYNRDIVVTDSGRNYIRIKRLCEDTDCRERETHFCPDGCYGASEGASGGTSSPAARNTALPPMMPPAAYPPVALDDNGRPQPVGPVYYDIPEPQ